MKKSEFISRIVNGLKALNKDARISKRYILNVGRDIVKDFVAKNISTGKLVKDLNLITYIDCFPMKPDDTIKCDIVEFKRCKDLAKSVCKLPKMIGADYGNSIVSVYSIDEMTEIKPISLNQYRRNQNRKATDTLFYYEKNGYLYIPDSKVRRVSLEIITLHPEDVDLSKCSCQEAPKEECIDIYDTEFIVPAKFSENVVKATLNEIILQKQMATDTNPNLNENA